MIKFQRRQYRFRQAVVLGLVFFLSGVTAAASGAGSQLDRLLGKNDAALVTSCRDGRVLYARQADLPLIPASIIKIITSLASFEYLGEDYRFKTGFYLTPAGDLVIKGYGDPGFTSREIERAAAGVSRTVETIEDIIVDDSFFAAVRIPGRSAPSLQPYDAPNGALCANFNTVAFSLEDGRFRSTEPETPLLPFAEKRLRKMPLDRGRVLLINHQDRTADYAGRLFAWFFASQGGVVSGQVRPGRVDPVRDRLIYRHQSDLTLKDTVGRLMRYSNNFTANQLLLACGAARSGPPGTLAKGLEALRVYLETSLGIKNARLEEGAGLSRKNRLTAIMMDKALAAFQPYHTIMRQEDGDYHKTGHLNGVSTRAGYISGPDGLAARYVIMINTPGRTADQLMPAVRQLAWNR